MKITPFFLWRDFWIGLFWDDQKRILYICPIPMFGVKIQFKVKPKSETKLYRIISRNRDYTYAEDKEGRMIVYPTNHYPSDKWDKDEPC